MPIYEYACDDCAELFERSQSIHDDSRPACPACDSAMTRRLISATSFQLKGGGWYVSDYKKSSNSSSTDATSP